MATLQQILARHFAEYDASRALSAREARAGRALGACRTGLLGGHVQRCAEGHVERVWYNSCRHRSCPQCNGLARERWLEQMRARLIDGAHHHIVFTMPHELNVLWMVARGAMTQTLFGAVRDTLMELLGDVRHLGATPGMVLALHTWTRSLALHPHIHALVTDGGLSAHGAWVRPRRSHFLPARVVMALFRGKLLAGLRGSVERGAIALPAQMSAERFTSLLNRLGRVKWNVRLCERYAHGEGIGIYLARYVKGGALSNRQILAADEQRVVFGYTPHGPEASVQCMSLGPQQFMARVLAHAPEPGVHVVRHYGLYAPTRRAALDQARALHAQQPVEQPEPLRWESYLARFANAAASTRCPKCGAALIRGARLAPVRSRPRAPPHIYPIRC